MKNKKAKKILVQIKQISPQWIPKREPPQKRLKPNGVTKRVTHKF